MSKESDRKIRINKCLKELDTIHENLTKDPKDYEINRVAIAKSLDRQLAALRLSQGETRLSNNLIIGLSSFGGALIGSVIGVMTKFI